MCGNLGQKKRNNVCAFVAEIYEKIEKNDEPEVKKQNMKANLLLKEIPDLHYYIVQNEDTTLLAHYRTNENGGLYVFDVDERKGYGAFYLSDFESVFSSAPPIPNC